MDPQESGRSTPKRLSELDVVYNPTLGAYLIWSAAKSYSEDTEKDGMPLPLAFLVLPLVLHWQSRGLAAATQLSSGLTLFASKLGAHQEHLLAVHQRAFAFRSLSLSSIALALAGRVIYLDPATTELSAMNIDNLPKLSDEVKQLRAASQKFGTWFARLPIKQVATALRVEF